MIRIRTKYAKYHISRFRIAIFILNIIAFFLTIAEIIVKHFIYSNTGIEPVNCILSDDQYKQTGSLMNNDHYCTVILKAADLILWLLGKGHEGSLYFLQLEYEITLCLLQQSLWLIQYGYSTTLYLLQQGVEVNIWFHREGYKPILWFINQFINVCLCILELAYITTIWLLQQGLTFSYWFYKEGYKPIYWLLHEGLKFGRYLFKIWSLSLFKLSNWLLYHGIEASLFLLQQALIVSIWVVHGGFIVSICLLNQGLKLRHWLDQQGLVAVVILIILILCILWVRLLYRTVIVNKRCYVMVNIATQAAVRRRARHEVLLVSLNELASFSQNVHDDSVEQPSITVLNQLQQRAVCECIDEKRWHREILTAIRALPTGTGTGADSSGLSAIDQNKAIAVLTNHTVMSISIRGYSYRNYIAVVWNVIRGHHQRSELTRRLAEEIAEGQDTCARGKINRLVNALRGYVDIGVDIADEHIGLSDAFLERVISNTSLKTYIAKTIMAETVLNEYGVVGEERNEWLNALYETN